MSGAGLINMGKHRNPIVILSILLLLTAYVGRTQSLPLNGSGKCEVTEVVNVDGFSKAILFTNEVKWLKGLAGAENKLNSVVKDSLAGSISGNFEFPVYAQSGILRKMAGTISYHFSIDTKEGKYRYTSTDFVFHYYVQDRNYKMVKTGKTKFLEEPKAAGWQKLWTEHRRTAATRVKRQIDELKLRMVETSKEVAKAEEKIVEW